MTNQGSAYCCTKSGDPTPREVRLELQAILGQLHGLISKASEQPDMYIWCPANLVEDVKRDCLVVSQAFGKVQAKLNTDAQDEQLRLTFLTSNPSIPILTSSARKAFEEALNQFFITTEGVPRYPEKLASAAGHGSTILNSLSHLFNDAIVIAELLATIKQFVEDKFKEGDQSGANNNNTDPGGSKNEGTTLKQPPTPKSLSGSEKKKLIDIITEEANSNLANMTLETFFNSLMRTAHLDYIEASWDKTNANDNARRLVQWVTERKEFPHKHDCIRDTPLGWLLIALLERDLQKSDHETIVKLIFDKNLISDPKVIEEIREKYQ